MSAVFTSHDPFDYQIIEKIMSCSSQLQLIFFFFCLYLVVVTQGGHKPCNQAFGGDQFDGQDSKECKAKDYFFDSWPFCLCIALSLSVMTLSYIQDNLNWVLEFGIPCIMMVATLLIFLLGTSTYQYSFKRDEKNPFIRIIKVFVEEIRNWTVSPS